MERGGESEHIRERSLKGRQYSTDEKAQIGIKWGGSHAVNSPLHAGIEGANSSVIL